MSTTTTQAIGKLVVNRDGHTAGPSYGQIYTAPAGDRGYIAGCRDYSVAGFRHTERFDTLAQAQQYLLDHGWY